jgi:4-diphosphocytidyl-2-C-methyl-D-erythritol kinase
MLTRRMVVQAPAKVNLFLSVGNRRNDGYHDIETIFHTIDLSDVLTVSVLDDMGAPRFSLCGDRPSGIAVEEDLIYRAFMHAELIAPLPRHMSVRVRVDKAIPERAGLGGGSVDAAAMLLVHATLAGRDVTSREYQQLALELGADVPFLLEGGCAWMSGRGDRLVERFDPIDLPVVVTNAGGGVSTAMAYRRFDEHPEPPRSPEALAAVLRDRQTATDPLRISLELWNSLAPAAKSLSSDISRELAWLEAQPEVVSAGVTGSGSACFALCADNMGALHVAARAGSEGMWATRAHFHSSGARIVSDDFANP